MIVLTRLNGTRFALNPDLVERADANPDTTLLMVDGTTYVVTETVDELVERIVDFRARVLGRVDASRPEPGVG
jgi:flagellar protein FlbD